MKDINVNQISSALGHVVKRLSKYSSFIFIISVLLIYTFLVFRIGTLSQAEPDPSAVTEKANTVRRLKLDQGEIAKIQQLEDQNIAVKSLFESARDNPFQN